MRDQMSLPTGSVPNRCPEVNGSMFASRMLPPMGRPTGPMSGQTKKASMRRVRMPAGMATSSERSQPRGGAWNSAPAGANAIAGTRASASGSCAAIADARVEDHVQQVGEQVGEHDDDGEHEHDPLHDEDVAVVDRL